MHRVIALLSLVALVAGTASLSTAHERRKPQVGRAEKVDFFPLVPNFTWVYRVEEIGRHRTYQMQARVIGERFVAVLNQRCLVVNEIDGIGNSASPVLYYSKNGFLNRIMGLEYVKGDIQPPSFGRSEEQSFLPMILRGGDSWEGDIFPFGHIRHALRVAEIHRSYAEVSPVVVPAGRFDGCIRVETHANYGAQGDGHQPDELDAELTYVDWYAPGVGLIRASTRPGGIEARETARIDLIGFDRRGAMRTDLPAENRLQGQISVEKRDR